MSIQLLQRTGEVYAWFHGYSRPAISSRASPRPLSEVVRRQEGLLTGIASAVQDAPLMAVWIVVEECEPIGLALRRFKKLLERQGVTWEMRRRGYFADPTQARRAKRFQKRFKARKATLLAQRAGEQPVTSITEATEAFWKRT
jgi:ribosomal protein S21